VKRGASRGQMGDQPGAGKGGPGKGGKEDAFKIINEGKGTRKNQG